VIDYTREHLDQILRDYDGALDLVGGETLTKTFAVMRRGGRVVSIAGVPEAQTAKQDLNAGPLMAILFWAISLKTRRKARKHGVSYRYFLMHPSGSDLSCLASFIDRRELEVVVDRVFPFEQIADAFEYLERGHASGKVIVQMVHD
jgi:alcohol dehydrogenase